MAPDQETLKSLLTADLFHYMVDTWIPFSKTDPIDFGEAIHFIFRASDGPFTSIRQRVYPALKALSEFGLDDFPDLDALLPQVDHPDYPVQALGLQLVLDQAPRVLLSGIDSRWTYGYFGPKCVQQALSWQSLSPERRPTAWSRWEALGASVDYWILVRLWFGAALVHAEETQEQAVAFTEETRTFVEEHFKTADPLRNDKRLEDLWAFPKMLAAAGPPPGAGAAEGEFWLALLMDVHKTIVDEYGRYPYQNWVLGRVPRPEEDEWMRKADGFRQPAEGVTNKIREDLEKGVWTPIGADWDGKGDK